MVNLSAWKPTPQEGVVLRVSSNSQYLAILENSLIGAGLAFLGTKLVPAAFGGPRARLTYAGKPN
jgi:hypothetical protein